MMKKHQRKPYPPSKKKLAKPKWLPLCVLLGCLGLGYYLLSKASSHMKKAHQLPSPIHFTVYSAHHSPAVAQHPATINSPQKLYYWQVASVSQLAQAEHLRAELGLHGLQSRIKKAFVGQNGSYQVLVGPYQTVKLAQASFDQLKQMPQIVEAPKLVS